MDGWTDRRVDRWTDVQTDRRKMNMIEGRKIDRRIYNIHLDRQTNRLMNGRTDERIDMINRKTDGQR